MDWFLWYRCYYLHWSRELVIPYSGFCFYCQKHWPEYNDEDYIEDYDNYNGNESGEDDQSNKMPMGASKTL